MRMRRKRNLDARLELCKEMLVISEGEDFYKIPYDQRKHIRTSAQLFGNDNKLAIEIGCGKGQFSVQYALSHPEVNLLAVEKLSNVIVEACEKAATARLNNLLFANCGAENLPLFLPEHSVSRILINFPCPYPKKTYANRRVTHPNYLEKYRRLLVFDGSITLKTDNLPFFEYSMEQFEKCGFRTVGKLSYTDKCPEGNIMTEYENKFVSQHLPIYIASVTPD